MRLLLILLLFPCALAAQPEMELLRSGNPIADGGTDSIDSTGTSPFNITWTIRNDGATDLTVSAPVVSGETNCTVTVLAPPTSPVSSAGGTTTFTLQVSPVTATDFSFDVSIGNDDGDENPYDFTLDGDPATPTIKSDGGGGGGSDGCSTGESPGLFWLVVCLLATLVHIRPTRRDKRLAGD